MGARIIRRLLRLMQGGRVILLMLSLLLPLRAGIIPSLFIFMDQGRFNIPMFPVGKLLPGLCPPVLR